MFSFFSPKAELGMVYHIGSASVGAGLVRFKKGEAPHVVYTHREPIPYKEQADPQRFLAEMVEALKRVNANMAKNGLSHLKFTEFGALTVRRVYYVFSSPWSVTQTRTAVMSHPEGFTLTKEDVNRIISEQEKIFESETLGDAADIKDKLEAIEKRVVQIKLNGYEVADPYGKKATRADVSLFISIVPKAVLEKVFDVSMTTYHPKDTSVYSFSLVSYSIIRDALHGENDYIFLDIGGELSDISIVKDGLILETASFPLGRHFIVRKVAKVFATTVEEAASLVTLHQEGKAEAALEEKLRPVIMGAIDEWLGAFRTVLGGFSKRMSLPSKLFVLMNNDFLPLFIRALKEEKISEFGVIEAPLSVTLLNHDKLRNAVAFGKHGDKDPFIAIIAAFAGNVYDPKEK